MLVGNAVSVVSRSNKSVTRAANIGQETKKSRLLNESMYLAKEEKVEL